MGNSQSAKYLTKRDIALLCFMHSKGIIRQQDIFPTKAKPPFDDWANLHGCEPIRSRHYFYKNFFPLVCDLGLVKREKAKYSLTDKGARWIMTHIQKKGSYQIPFLVPVHGTRIDIKLAYQGE